MGGDASAAAGIEIVADIRRSAAMGFTEVATRLPRLAIPSCTSRAVRAAERPRAAVLVDYTEYNHLLGRRLREIGFRFCGALLRRYGRGDPGERLDTAGVRRSHGGDSSVRRSDLARAGVDALYVGPSRARRPPGRAAKRVHAVARGGLGRRRAASLGAAPTRFASSRLRCWRPGRAEASGPSRRRASRGGRILSIFSRVALASGPLHARQAFARVSTSTPERALPSGLPRSMRRWSRRERPRSRARSPERLQSWPIVFQDDRGAGASHGSNAARGSAQRHSRGCALSRAAARAGRADAPWRAS